MSTLRGCRVLLVEDESLVAMLAEDMLSDLGCEVVVAMRLEQALDQVQSHMFDLAILDVNLGETRSYPIADTLAELGTPFIFATGYGTAGLKREYAGAPVVQKPYQSRDLQYSLLRLLGCDGRLHGTTGTASGNYA